MFLFWCAIGAVAGTVFGSSSLNGLAPSCHAQPLQVVPVSV